MEFKNEFFNWATPEWPYQSWQNTNFVLFYDTRKINSYTNGHFVPISMQKNQK